MPIAGNEMKMKWNELKYRSRRPQGPSRLLVFIRDDYFFSSLPIGGYKFLQPEEDSYVQLVAFFDEIDRVFNEEELTDLDMPIWEEYFPEKDGYGEGFFVQVDIEIPEHLHDKLQYLPPAPCHTSVSTSSLPPHMQEMYKQRYGEAAKGSTSEKLIASLLDKKDVVLHYTTAEMYARMGARLTIKKVLRFTQGRILESWIQKATMGRKAAALAGDELLVALYKLIINSVFGEKVTLITMLIITITVTLNIIITIIISPSP